MKTNLKTKILSLLEKSDGMTVTEIGIILNIAPMSVRLALKREDIFYIDRWLKPQNSRWSAVWKNIDIPQDCPKPSVKKGKVMKISWLVTIECHDGKIIYIHFIAKEYEDAMKDAQALYPNGKILSCVNYNGRKYIKDDEDE